MAAYDTEARMSSHEALSSPFGGRIDDVQGLTFFLLHENEIDQGYQD